MTATSPNRSAIGVVSLDAERDVLASLPWSDWLRLWCNIRAKYLPSAIAREIQDLTTRTCVQGFTYLTIISPLPLIVLGLRMPLNPRRAAFWFTSAFWLTVLVLALAAVLQHKLRVGSLTARGLYRYLFIPAVWAGLQWASFPSIIAADQTVHFYLANVVSLMYCVVAYLWLPGYNALATLKAVIIQVGIYALGLSRIAPAGEVVFDGLLSASFQATLFVISGAACLGFTYARYNQVAAREREELLSLTLRDYETVGHDFFWEADEALRLNYVPSRMVEAARADPRIVLGASLFEVVTDADALESIEIGEPFRVVERTSGPAGEGEVGLYGRPKTLNGEVIGYRGIGSDEGAARRAAETERTNERLESLERLTSGLAHDFNNQLATVMGAVELASLDPTLRDTTRQYLGRAVDACLRTRRTTADLVVATGHDASYEPDRFNTRRAVDQVSIDMRHSFPEVSISVDGVEQAWVDADKSHFMRAMQNLIQNACQSILDAGVAHGDVGVLVETERAMDASRVLITISDNGPGVDSALVDRIFEPFTTSRRAQGGTGLGLSVARGFAHQSGGTLELVPAATGAVFRMDLPSAPPGPESEPLATEAQPPSDPAVVLSGYFVVVEDDPGVAKNLSGWLEAIGAEVDTAESVAEAVDRFRGRVDDIECVISDLALPDGEGFEVIAALRDKRPDLKAIYVSGFSQTLPANVAPELRCPFVAKPFSLGELVGALRRAGVSVAPRETAR